VYVLRQDLMMCWPKGATTAQLLLNAEQPGKPPGHVWYGMTHDRTHALVARLADGDTDLHRMQ
jgi:hypothetical protein